MALIGKIVHFFSLFMHHRLFFGYTIVKKYSHSLNKGIIGALVESLFFGNVKLDYFTELTIDRKTRVVNYVHDTGIQLLAYKNMFFVCFL